MTEGSGFGRDSGTPKRRMLPAVTDVVRDLARTVSADPAVLFKAARSVVADELARVKQGFESAPLDVLVKRARRQLEAEGVATPVPEAEEPKPVSIPVPPFKPREKPEPKPGSEAPFPSAGAPDLDWEKDLPIQPDDAPFRSAILPLPKSRTAKGVFSPEEAPAPSAPSAPPAAPAPPAVPRLPVPERVTAPEGLAVERSGSAPLPRTGVDDLPLFSSPTSPPAVLEPLLAPPPPPPPRAHEPQRPAARPEPVFEPAPSPAEPGPADADAPPFEHRSFEPPAPEPQPRAPYVEPRRSRYEPPASAVPARRIERSTPKVDPPPPYEPPAPPEEPARRIEPAVTSMSEMPPLGALIGDVTEPVEPEMGQFAFKAPERPAPPKPAKSGRMGWIAAVVVVLAVAAGLVWGVRTFLSGGVVKTAEGPAPKKRAEPAPAAAEAPVPVPAAPRAEPKAAPAPAPPAAAAKAPAPPVAKGKAALLLTPDWAGKPPVFVVHFSSSKDRPSADKEAKRLTAELGRPARAVEVDLGDKGIWYRAVVGEFATVDEARAYRAELEAKKTPGLGFVYEMRGR